MARHLGFSFANTGACAQAQVHHSLLPWTELNNDERSAVQNAGDRARTRLGRPGGLGGLFKMADICGIFPYGKQTGWLSTVLRG